MRIWGVFVFQMVKKFVRVWSDTLFTTIFTLHLYFKRVTFWKLADNYNEYLCQSITETSPAHLPTIFPNYFFWKRIIQFTNLIVSVSQKHFLILLFPFGNFQEQLGFFWPSIWYQMRSCLLLPQNLFTTKSCEYRLLKRMSQLCGFDLW